jgi:hypothetical protein
MNTSLTTFDGFPRADIDVAQGLWPVYLYRELNSSFCDSSNDSS